MLDALPFPLAAADAHGKLLAVNRRWLEATEEGVNPFLGGAGVGVDYFDLCRRIGDDCASDAARALAGLQAVAEGRLPDFELYYTCQAPASYRRWILRASPLVALASPGLIIAHIDVTQFHHAQEAAAQAQAAAEWNARQEEEMAVLTRLSAAPPSPVTARMLGLETISQAEPELFQDLIQSYGQLLDLALDQRAYKIGNRLSDELRSLADRLGYLGAGPRDVIEIHTSALRRRLESAAPPRQQAYIDEGRLMALELMGHLVSYYSRRAIRSVRGGLKASVGHRLAEGRDS